MFVKEGGKSLHVYKKPSGLWAYKIDIGKNPQTGKRQQKEKGGFRRAKDARIAGEEALQRYRNKGFARPEAVTFGDFAKEWLKTYATIAKVSSVRIRKHQLGHPNRYFEKFIRSNIRTPYYLLQRHLRLIQFQVSMLRLK